MGWETGIESQTQCKYNNLQRSRRHVIPSFRCSAARTACERHGTAAGLVPITRPWAYGPKWPRWSGGLEPRHLSRAVTDPLCFNLKGMLQTVNVPRLIHDLNFLTIGLYCCQRRTFSPCTVLPCCEKIPTREFGSDCAPNAPCVAHHFESPTPSLGMHRDPSPPFRNKNQGQSRGLSCGLTCKPLVDRCEHTTPCRLV